MVRPSQTALLPQPLVSFLPFRKFFLILRIFCRDLCLKPHGLRRDHVKSYLQPSILTHSSQTHLDQYLGQPLELLQNARSGAPWGFFASTSANFQSYVAPPEAKPYKDFGGRNTHWIFYRSYSFHQDTNFKLMVLYCYLSPKSQSTKTFLPKLRGFFNKKEIFQTCIRIGLVFVG